MSSQKEPTKPRQPKVRKGKDGELIVTDKDGIEKTLKPGEGMIVEMPEQEDPRPDQPDVSEGDVDYAAIAEGLLTKEKPTNGVQVFDGEPNKAKLEDFGYQTAHELHELIHFIEVNDLTTTPPWAVVYTMHRALLAYAEEHP